MSLECDIDARGGVVCICMLGLVTVTIVINYQKVALCEIRNCWLRNYQININLNSFYCSFLS